MDEQLCFHGIENLLISTISIVISIAENTSIPGILKINLTISLSQAYLDISGYDKFLRVKNIY